MNNKEKIKQLKELLNQSKPKNATSQTWEKRQEALRKEIEMLEKGITPPKEFTPQTMRSKFWGADKEYRETLGTGWSNSRMKLGTGKSKYNMNDYFDPNDIKNTKNKRRD